MEPLPRILNKREAKYTTDLVKWVRDNIKHPCLIEVKQTKSSTLPANSLKPHQIKTLLAKSYTQKISDALRQRQPADIIHYYNTTNYIIVIYGDGSKLLIKAKDFPPIDEKLTQAHAERIACMVIK